MTRFSRSFVFRYTVVITGLFVALEIVVFSVLYWSTLRVYESSVNAQIEAEAATLQNELVGLTVTEMAAVITRRCTDEPGEFDEFMLATQTYEFIAGNVIRWPGGVERASGLVDVLLGEGGHTEHEVHRVRAVMLPNGHRLLVGRNLTELERMEYLIREALASTVLLTLVLGFGGGFVVSRGISARVEKMSDASEAILDGQIQRMPLSGSGDEFDRLATQLNSMLERIEALVRGMRDVSDNIAHDIRKPISRLRGRIEFALMTAKDTDTYRRVLVESIEEVDQILAMFNALLTITMAESGAPRDRFEQVDLGSIVESTAEIYGPAAEEAGLQLELQVDSNASLSGDPHLLAQALANLLENAIKYAPNTGTLTVEARHRAGGVELVVADRGPGIPEAFREKALERFTRVEKSRTSPSFGLGLSLVQAVARLHGATLELSDNRPGLRVSLGFKPLQTITDR